MRIDFRFEAPIIQVHVQIITYIPGGRGGGGGCTPFSEGDR